MGGPANYAEVSTTSPNISGCNINPKNNIDDGQVYNIGFNYSSENDLPATIKLTYSDLSGKRYTHEGFLGVDEEDSVSFFNNHSSSPSDKTTVIKN